MVESATQIKSGILINDGASAKIQNNIACEKKIISGILQYVVVKMVNIW